MSENPESSSTLPYGYRLARPADKGKDWEFVGEDFVLILHKKDLEKASLTEAEENECASNDKLAVEQALGDLRRSKAAALKYQKLGKKGTLPKTTTTWYEASSPTRSPTKQATTLPRFKPTSSASSFISGFLFRKGEQPEPLTEGADTGDYTIHRRTTQFVDTESDPTNSNMGDIPADLKVRVQEISEEVTAIGDKCTSHENNTSKLTKIAAQLTFDRLKELQEEAKELYNKEIYKLDAQTYTLTPYRAAKKQTNDAIQKHLVRITTILEGLQTRTPSNPPPYSSYSSSESHSVTKNDIAHLQWTMVGVVKLQRFI